MMRSLRAFFLGRLLREKLLLLVFIVLGTLIWLSAFTKRANVVWLQQRSTSSTLKTQREFLARESEIDAAVKRAASQLESSKTYTKTMLVTEISNLSSAAGFRANTRGDNVQTTGNGQFQVHSYTWTISNIPQSNWQALQKFYVSLRDRSPYIVIDQFALQTQGQGGPLTLQLRVSAFEPLH
jgi:hypothetical protein